MIDGPAETDDSAPGVDHHGDGVELQMVHQTREVIDPPLEPIGEDGAVACIRADEIARGSAIRSRHLDGGRRQIAEPDDVSLLSILRGFTQPVEVLEESLETGSAAYAYLTFDLNGLPADAVAGSKELARDLAEVAAAFRPGNTILDRIFNQGLQQQAGDQRVFRGFLNIDFKCQTLFKTYLFDIQVKLQGL